MSAPRHRDDWVHTIQDAWAPPPSDAQAFDATLHARLRGQRRRRAVLAGAAVAGLVLLGASHLIGGPQELGSPRVELPAPAPVVATAEQGVGSSFFGQALDSDQRGFELPGAYGALDELFLDPYDQEL
jgi:hypothetical protein